LLAQVIITAQRAKKSVALCGEMAGDTRYTAMLLALGLTEFSMHPSSLLEVRQAIARCDHGKLRAAAKVLLRAQSRAGIERALEQLQAD